MVRIFYPKLNSLHNSRANLRFKIMAFLRNPYSMFKPDKFVTPNFKLSITIITKTIGSFTIFFKTMFYKGIKMLSLNIISCIVSLV